MHKVSKTPSFSCQTGSLGEQREWGVDGFTFSICCAPWRPVVSSWRPDPPKGAPGTRLEQFSEQWFSWDQRRIQYHTIWFWLFSWCLSNYKYKWYLQLSHLLSQHDSEKAEGGCIYRRQSRNCPTNVSHNDRCTELCALNWRQQRDKCPETHAEPKIRVHAWIASG